MGGTGWRIDQVVRDDRGFSASRELDGHLATLAVVQNLDPAFPPAPGVFVTVSQPGDQRHADRPSSAPVDGVVRRLQARATERVVLGDPRDPTAQVRLPGW